ncbi:YjfB family protein [Clostridium sp. SM-530-WT-3G]|uniref:putative motility protein n=1 Tax=Clostridium sp. SM-530-WT-3G TaxID=2725303 RepID=UPI00145EF04D|nr:YjfB family protein [Clostridium sp. SM-530-WT-3G]NME82793.1 putative motility protein [Clostridium sp. SM-530-WT-3G]
MDIGTLSMSMSNASLASAVQMSVLKMGMNMNKQISNVVNDMMSNMSVEPDKGIHLDAKV